jgi:hypothetical protein
MLDIGAFRRRILHAIPDPRCLGKLECTLCTAQAYGATKAVPSEHNRDITV